MSRRDDEARDRARAEAEEQAWRDIVDHYGDGPDVPGLIELTTPLTEPTPAEQDEPFLLDLDDDESFTPPPLPPPAVISPERRVAWVGLVASPLLLVLLQLLDYPLPGILSVGLVVACIVSFGYLVATMAPRDPDDDGARL
ncbi:MAG TPA: hypothetical protein VGK78_07330 [Nocardioides sp.]|uniref:hypothetical protein n=1 Tax=Nocardioides sp. TaxID=35761 RepID=UPI002F3E549A